MLVYIATTNAGKLREFGAICVTYGWRVDSYEGYRAPEEGETSYAGNAARKARALAAQLRDAGITASALGDDSGIEVAALGGRPGVLSARYGGPAATWAERRANLLAELDASGSNDRAARFVSALHFVDAQGREFATEAAIEGTIAARDRGDGGFSYDPIFFYPPLARTFGESSEQEKNWVSHRALAVRALAAALSRDGGSHGM